MVLSFGGLRRRQWMRILLGGVILYATRSFLRAPTVAPSEIRSPNVLSRVTRSDKSLDVQRFPFLQARLGREDEDDLLTGWIRNGVMDFWERFQLPFIVSRDTSPVDEQVVRGAIEDLLALNGWVGAECPTLIRPFGQNKREDAYDDLASANHMYFIALVIHSADHFLVDQLALIVQMARRLGPRNLFVSMFDYASRDATPTLTDLSEAVLTLLGIPFRIRRVTDMTEDETAAYYPLEEAYTRNLVLEPLHELRSKRNIRFDRVIWIKGFTCPNDIFETIKVSMVNKAAMVCGMDWAEHNGFFIFSDRWRTRDMNGDQFRLARSSAINSSSPPRDAIASERYAQHLPFQIFCCESGTHVVDPAQSYYRGLRYRAATGFKNVTEGHWSAKDLDPEGDCMDSSQAWFCRDLWTESARYAIRETVKGRKALPTPALAPQQQLFREEEIPSTHPLERRQQPRKAVPTDEDADAGSDYDAMPDISSPPLEPAQLISENENLEYRPARILVNPRCVTTYAGVSHTKLAADLFGDDRDVDGAGLEYDESQFLVEEWRAAPDSFVCQEQRTTGGRKASKTQRRVEFSIHSAMKR